MDNHKKVIAISFKHLLLDLVRVLEMEDPFYGTLGNVSTTACVVLLSKGEHKSYFTVGKMCATLLESEESAAENVIQSLVLDFSLTIDDISKSKQERCEQCFGLFLKAKGNRSAFRINEVMETKIVIPIDFMDLLQKIQNEMDIHLTRSYCIKLGFAKFVSWIGVRCLRESNELEWIVGEDCFTANTAMQSMAKKVIVFLEPIYHFEVRDVNYKTMKKSRSFSLLQREHYLNAMEMKYAFNEGGVQEGEETGHQCVTPTSTTSHILLPSVLPPPPKKPKVNRICVIAPPNGQFMQVPLDISEVFKHT